MKRTIAAAASVSGPGARILVLALTALLFLGASLAARAQGSNDVDPPDRVARLSEMSGQVWLFSPDANEWIAVARNRPITTGDRIATDNGAHAEIGLGSTTLRLDSATELEVVLLDDNVFQVQLHSGSVAARLRNSASVAEFTLDTDEGRFRAQAVGRYRFDRFEQTSDLTVDAGRAVFEGRNSALPLTAGQHAQFWLDASGAPQYNMVEPTRDAFAAWNAERDRAEPRPTAAVRYVSPEMTGAEDLDRYGQWEQTADYGPIWTPRAVGVGWAPYSAGHWAYVRPWGWTWVDDAPWGFAPFHYGRWVNYRSRWCWVPGTYVARPVYAPALVAWIGGVSISVGGGRAGPPVGWFPLAPREVYVPSYRYSSPRLRAQHQRHPRHQRHPDHDHRQQHQRRRRPARLRQPQVPACRDRGAGERRHRPATGRCRSGALPQRSAGSRAGGRHPSGEGDECAPGRGAAGACPAAVGQGHGDPAAVRRALAGGVRRPSRPGARPGARS